MDRAHALVGLEIAGSSLEIQVEAKPIKALDCPLDSLPAIVAVPIPQGYVTDWRTLTAATVELDPIKDPEFLLILVFAAALILPQFATGSWTLIVVAIVGRTTTASSFHRNKLLCQVCFTFELINV